MPKPSHKKRAEAIGKLLSAAEYLRTHHAYEQAAEKELLTCAVKALGLAIYMKHGLRIDRDVNTGELILLGESNYHATHDGRLIRLGGGR